MNTDAMYITGFGLAGVLGAFLASSGTDLGLFLGLGILGLSAIIIVWYFESERRKEQIEIEKRKDKRRNNN